MGGRVGRVCWGQWQGDTGCACTHLCVGGCFQGCSVCARARTRVRVQWGCSMRRGAVRVQQGCMCSGTVCAAGQRTCSGVRVSTGAGSSARGWQTPMGREGCAGAPACWGLPCSQGWVTAAPGS